MAFTKTDNLGHGTDHDPKRSMILIGPNFQLGLANIAVLTA